MTRRFVVATDPLSAEAEKKLQDVFAGKGWWHWLPNFWLVKDSNDQLTAEEIMDAVGRISPNARCVVIEVDHKYWAGRVRKDSQGRDMAQWLRDTWQ